MTLILKTSHFLWWAASNSSLATIGNQVSIPVTTTLLRRWKCNLEYTTNLNITIRLFVLKISIFIADWIDHIPNSDAIIHLETKLGNHMLLWLKIFKLKSGIMSHYLWIISIISWYENAAVKSSRDSFLTNWLEFRKGRVPLKIAWIIKVVTEKKFSPPTLSRTCNAYEQLTF